MFKVMVDLVFSIMSQNLHQHNYLAWKIWMITFYKWKYFVRPYQWWWMNTCWNYNQISDSGMREEMSLNILLHFSLYFVINIEIHFKHKVIERDLRYIAKRFSNFSHYIHHIKIFVKKFNIIGIILDDNI